MAADFHEILKALVVVSPDDRDTWVRMGMAIKAELGDDGFSTWHRWSQRGASYNERDARDVWKSIDQDGGITIASLFAEAKANGYQTKTAHNGHEAPKTPDGIWQAGTESGAGNHAYLKAKAVSGHGVKVNGNTLLVPVKDLDGKLLSVQSIFKKDGAWQKRFTKDAKLEAGCHTIGNLYSGVIILAEGYATGAAIYEATGHPVVIAFDCGRLATVGKAIREKYPKTALLIAGDEDAHLANNPGRAKATKAGKDIGASVVFPGFQSGSGGDFNDLMLAEGAEAVRAQIEAALQAVPEANPSHTRLVAVTIHDLLSRELPPIEPLLSPWLGKQSLNMVYAWRGVGKTHFALNLAYAVASGGQFLGWMAPEPNGILYIDGEMPGGAMQARLASIIAAHQTECDPERFRIITPDLQSSFMPDLATQQGQDQIEEHITADTKLIVVDNLSALVRRGGRENDAESWLMVGEWAMFQRSRGRSVLFIHHAGKDGRQRGTSKREDILDAVVCLSRPSDYDPKEGARFTVEFQKDRHNTAGQPFEAKLQSDAHGGQIWTTKPLESSRMEQFIDLAELGMSLTDIAAEVGCNKSTVSRALRKAEDEGLYTPPKKANGKGKVIDIKTRKRRDVDD